MLSQTLPYLKRRVNFLPELVQLWEGYEHLTQKVIVSLWKPGLLPNHLMLTWMIYIWATSRKRLAGRKLEYSLIKLTSLIEFASFLEPSSDAFHGIFSFNKIAINIPDERAAFLVWN